MTARPNPNAFARGLAFSAAWAARALVVLGGLVVICLLVRALWAVVFPLLLAVQVTSLLWPTNRLLRRALPRSLAALVSVLVLLGAVTGTALIVLPSVASGVRELAVLARSNLNAVTDLMREPPLNWETVDLNLSLARGLSWLSHRWEDVLFGITSGLGSATTLAVVVLLTLALTFFCLKDGDRFLPWTRRWTNQSTYTHTARIAQDAWRTLSAYILTQITVALVDAVFIGLGLWLLDVPLALPLAVAIFFAGFIPVVGAVSTGLLATLIALIAHGWVTGLIALAVVLVVQQLETNLLQPILVGKALEIHPGVVIGAVTVGFTLFGIVGAFLAVPVTAVAIVGLRYLRDQVKETEPEITSPTESDSSHSTEGNAAPSGDL